MSYLIALIFGLLSSLPFIFPGLWIVAWFSSAPLFWLAAQKKAAYRHGLAFFTGFYGVLYYWFVYLYPMDYAGFDNIQSIAVIAVSWIGMTALQAPVFALVPLLYRRLRTGRAYADPFLAASLWVIFEWLQTQTWMGVPWGRLAVSQYASLPAIQASSLLGSLFVSFLIVLANGFIAVAAERKFTLKPVAALTAGNRANNTTAGNEGNADNAAAGGGNADNTAADSVNGVGTDGATDAAMYDGSPKDNTNTAFSRTNRRTPLICIAIAVAIFAANLIYGAAALAAYDDGGAEGVTAAVIQGNIASGDKWKDDSVAASLALYSQLTIDASIKYCPQIVLWPETVITAPLRSSKSVCESISQLAKATGAVILVGAFDYVYDEVTDETYRYNAIVAFYPDGKIGDMPYYKRHLVPFGEYLPMPWFFKTFIPVLAEMNLFKSDLSPGTDTNLIKTYYGKLGGLVCFDSIYGELVRSSVNDGANLLVLSTNDSWYRDSASVYQHNGHAVLRAVENGRYVVRAANTGVSTVISPTGEILTMLGPLTKGFAAAEVKMLSTRTLYSYVGDLWLIACAVLAAACGIYKVVNKIRE